MTVKRFRYVFSLEQRIIDLFLEAINKGEKNEKRIEDRIVYILSKARFDETQFRKAIRIMWDDICAGKTVAKAVNEFFMNNHVPKVTSMKDEE
jgi:hypothetical protein